jgi:transcriptional regulator of heat shock response
VKKSILLLAVLSLISANILTGCDTPAEKVENAQANVDNAKQNLDKANDEYLVDIENYRKITAEKIAANDKSIAEFNARIENQKKEAREEYKNKIAALEQKNTDMKKKMDDYKAQGKDNWEIFKSDINHDMDDISNGFTDLKKNEK